jgi:tetratricopeptide (TPR) repeat protein
MKTIHITKSIIVFATTVCLHFTTHAQSVQEIMYKAYMTRSIELWERALDITGKQAQEYPKDKVKQLEFAFVYYSLLNGSMALQDEDFFDKHVGDAKELLKRLVNDYPNSGEACAMLSNIYGNEIAYSSFKGMTLGSKSSNLAEKGKQLEPTSPLAWKVYASNKYYTPSAFGGDLQEAIKAAEKSIHLFESNNASLKNNWSYLDTIVLLAQAYQKNNEKSKAIAAYEKALALEPQFYYAKMLLSEVKK